MPWVFPEGSRRNVIPLANPRKARRPSRAISIMTATGLDFATSFCHNPWGHEVLILIVTWHQSIRATHLQSILCHGGRERSTPVTESLLVVGHLLAHHHRQNCANHKVTWLDVPPRKHYSRTCHVNRVTSISSSWTSMLQEIRRIHRSDLDTVSEDAAKPVPEAIPQV